MSPQFEELSRKAAAGTLTTAEREWLDTYLREHPGERIELEWDEAFGAKLEAKIASMPALPGWERTQRILKTEPAAARSPGMLDRLSDWLSASLGFSLNAQAIAAALVVVQAGVIGVFVWQSQDREYSEIRTGTPDATPRGPLLRVSFRQDLREAELRRALADVGGEIVGGPGQLGVYLVRIKAGDLAAAAQRLRASGTTELVEVVEAKR